VKSLSTLAVSIIVALVAGCGLIVNPLIVPNSINVPNAEQTVRDARSVIDEQRTSPQLKPPLREPHELPESLRLPGLLYAVIHEDHLNLVLSRNPDVNVGARIWSADSKREHRDWPTKYPDIFFYQYDNDASETPDNIQ
jgi:hypothetical protein